MNRITLRAQRASRPQGVICQFCQFSTSAPRRALPFARVSTSSENRTPTSSLTLHSSRRAAQNPPKVPLISLRHDSTRTSRASEEPLEALNGENAMPEPSAIVEESPEIAVHYLTEIASRQILGVDRVPQNDVVQHFFSECEAVTNYLVSLERDQAENPSTTDEGNAISSLLEMEEKLGHKRTAKEDNHQGGNSQVIDPRLANTVASISTKVIKDEKVFISPEILEKYVTIQSRLGQSEHLPEIFHLYANKPIPEEKSSPPRFLKPNPKDVNSAVPAELANMALNVAIQQKNLPLVLAIIDKTFCAPAFHRAKIFRKAGIPLAGLAGAPAACYALASWAATFQHTMDPSTATGIAFAASLAYVGGTSSIGILAITTANDQMERVTWLPGVPLRHRWLREEERAAMDKVAVAWGFKDPYMRGEEVGEEWESLREFIGMRGMILDKTELMEGMQ
ncbi:hypothetical protein N7462_005564 [Penicillium macrosclerotiorum]|uniref:uncharacterized protein n=1 Tax=Penicillium macrosclerotiorum TaxID=303699 RepID=UPI0025481E71|nr:uncharacterized protein N7462_005564 [Penicillium macrosclerotiorum]KAJ5682399.1 hypothetical protein N7462_005564 [Penicillium macrosclerotiorum]